MLPGVLSPLECHALNHSGVPQIEVKTAELGDPTKVLNASVTERLVSLKKKKIVSLEGCQL